MGRQLPEKGKEVLEQAGLGCVAGGALCVGFKASVCCVQTGKRDWGKPRQESPCGN